MYISTRIENYQIIFSKSESWILFCVDWALVPGLQSPGYCVQINDMLIMFLLSSLPVTLLRGLHFLQQFGQNLISTAHYQGHKSDWHWQDWQDSSNWVGRSQSTVLGGVLSKSHKISPDHPWNCGDALLSSRYRLDISFVS